MNILEDKIIQFHLPNQLACPLPTEERNIKRDEVRLLVSDQQGNSYHDHFYNLDKYLEAGDLLVVNSSATIPSALKLDLPNGNQGRLHLSNKMNATEWLVEIRELVNNKTIRWKAGKAGMIFQLEAGAEIRLKQPFFQDKALLHLWLAELHLAVEEQAYLMQYAAPIKYTQLGDSFPISYYQTYFAYHPGSAEMPSAARGFTERLVKKLLNKGVQIVDILLHTGISSLEVNEKPYPEYMELSPLDALKINQAKAMGKRVIAIGTTAVRAVESAAVRSGAVEAFIGNTELYITEDYQMKIVDGLLTGFHEPQASHLHMLQSIAGFEQIERAYRIALEEQYYWHQFGDLHLILS